MQSFLTGRKYNMSQRRLPFPEFVALVAMLFAMIAVSIDAMLPGLTLMGEELTPDAPNLIMMVVLLFVLGMGIGTFITGALADAFGRKTVIIGGAVVYFIASILSYYTESLELLLAARFIQGFGASGPRIAVLAMVRDLFEGPEMAKVMSIAMTIFMIVPAIAPMIGYYVIAGFGWRAMFALFAAFSFVIATWLFLRQAETLTEENRRPLSMKSFVSAFIEIMSNRIVVITMLTQTLVISFLFATISTIQPIFEHAYDKADSFPFYFAGIAIIAASANIVNAKLVVRLGMRKMVTGSLIGHTIVSGIVLLTILLIPLPFWMYLLLVTTNFLVLGFCMGNLTTLALEPMGHIAGMTSSITAGVSTVIGAAIGVPVTQFFDGTPLSLAIGAFITGSMALMLMIYLGPRPPE